MPVYSLGAWAIDQSSPPDPALRHGCNFLPGVPHLPRFRLHVSPPGFLGRPRFLFPWGFHVSACLVMLVVGFLSVWPIQRHFLHFSSISTGSWFVLVHKVLLLTLSDHFTFMILRRHLFTNVCILFTVCLVSSHVLELYNRTDLTLELNILILVFSLISFDFQILLSMRKATRAFWIRAVVSSSVSPVLFIWLPRYSMWNSLFPPVASRLRWLRSCSSC